MNFSIETVQHGARMDLEEMFETFPRGYNRETEIAEAARKLGMRYRQVKAVFYREARSDTLIEFQFKYQAWKDRAVARESSKAQSEYVELMAALKALERRLADTH